MIRVYSDPCIALAVNPTFNPSGEPMTIVLAEVTFNGNQQTLEIPVRFVGQAAERAAEQIVVGAQFTFRGDVQTAKVGDRKEIVVAAKKFAVIA